MAKINKREILKILREKPQDKKKVTLYVSASLYKDFQKACEDIPASVVIEELMRHFIK